MPKDKTRKHTKRNVARNCENHYKSSSFFSLNIRCSSQPYTIKYITSSSDCISDFASFERTKKKIGIYKRMEMPFLEVCFIWYLELTNGQFSWEIKAKPQEKLFSKMGSEVLRAGENWTPLTTQGHSWLRVWSLQGVILNILNYYENA